MFEKFHVAVVLVWCELTVHWLLQTYACKYPPVGRPGVESKQLLQSQIDFHQ